MAVPWFYYHHPKKYEEPDFNIENKLPKAVKRTADYKYKGHDFTIILEETSTLTSIYMIIHNESKIGENLYTNFINNVELIPDLITHEINSAAERILHKLNEK